MLKTRESGNIFTLFRDALRGSHMDYTDGPIGRAVLMLAIPMVLELILESVLAVVDVFFVSRLGADAIATVGLTESMLTIMYAVVIGLCTGVTAVVARRIGERDADGAARAAVQAIALGVAFSIPVGIGGVWLAPRMLAFMGASPGVIANVSYTRVMFGLNIVILMLFLLNAVFRGAGDATVAMRVLWTANAINLCLDPCLIFGLGPFHRFGVTGAAIATTTGRGIAVLLQLIVLWRGTDRITIRWNHLRIEPDIMLNMVRLSGSAVFQSLIATTSWVVLVRTIASFGSNAVAAYTITIRIVIFALLPAWGLANAAATLVGQNLGAGEPERAELSVWQTCRYAFWVFAAMTVVFLIVATPLVGAFTRDAPVLAIATPGLRIATIGFLGYALGLVVSQAFNGAGDMWSPMIVNLVSFWVFGVTLAYVLAQRLSYGPSGVFVAITSGFVMMAVSSVALFRRGTWKTKRV
ncbi:MAG TPA: MATE family efflux transporter [Vicinamibacterales bacterium]|nr:MATE family efflux transporter [Vicinamibacterales bacterium]